MAPDIYLSIGSNSSMAVEMIRRGIDSILAIEGAEEIARGRLYRTEPQGVREQEWFVNSALAIRLELGPEETLKRIKAVEISLGRTPGRRWGPRAIDIDIIFYGGLVMTTDDLTIPHPMAAGRRFVLAPLADINPGLIHPALGRSVAELLAELPEKGQAVYPIQP